MTLPQPPAEIGLHDAIRDAEHLKLLSVFHYVLAALTALASSLPVIHVVLGIMIVSGRMPGGATIPPGEAAFGWIFIVMGAVVILLGWTMAALTFLAGRWISQRRHRTFVFVMACVQCLSVPLGTALGVFTILVLERPGVRAAFDQHARIPHSNT